MRGAVRSDLRGRLRGIAFTPQFEVIVAYVILRMDLAAVRIRPAR